MATTSPESARRFGHLTLVDKDPDVEPSASDSGRFDVKFAFEGSNLLELQNALAPRLAAAGVQRVTRSGMTITLCGVKHGREAEVFAEIQSAIEDVNRTRRAAEDNAEERRTASDAASAASAVRLSDVRAGFHAARQSGIAR